MSNPNQYATGWHPCDKCRCLLPPTLPGPRCTDAAWCRLAKAHREKMENDFAPSMLRRELAKAKAKAGRK